MFTTSKEIEKKFLKKKISNFFFALNDSNLREIEKKFWALSFIAVVFVEFAVVFMNSTANMTKTTAMDTLVNALVYFDIDQGIHYGEKA